MLDRPTPSRTAMTPAEKTFYAQLGRRLAARRKELGITQVQLAETLGVAQQTLAHYEGGKVRITAAALPLMAQALQVEIEDLIGSAPAKTRSKRGPSPKIQQQLERLSKLPKPKQRAVEQILESVLASAA